MTSRSTISTSGQREGTVRFTPSRSSTAMSSENALTDTAVWTTTNGMPPARIEASLATSVTVPEPTDTTQPAPAMPASGWASASASACSSPAGVVEGTVRVGKFELRRPGRAV